MKIMTAFLDSVLPDTKCVHKCRMKKETELKVMVKDRYAKIAEQGKAVNASSCCGATVSSNKIYNIMMDDYTETEGYNEEADLGLGCGLPTQLRK